MNGDAVQMAECARGRALCRALECVFLLSGWCLAPTAARAQDDMTGWSGVIQHEYMSSSEKSTTGSLTALNGMQGAAGNGSEQETYVLRTTYLIRDGQVQASHMVRSDKRSSSSGSMIYACTLEELFVRPRTISGGSEHSEQGRDQGSGPGECTLTIDPEVDDTNGMVMVSCSSEAKATSHFTVSGSETCSGCCGGPVGTPSVTAAPGESSSSEEDIPSIQVQQTFPKGRTPRTFAGSERTETEPDDKNGPVSIHSQSLSFTGVERRQGHHTTSWTLWRKDLDIVLEVEPQNYDSWRPKGGEDESTRGNALLVKAFLRLKNGKPADVDARRIEFKLPHRSSEPGVMMNWPAPALAKKDEPDLRFDEDLNAPFELKIEGDRGDKATTKDGTYKEASAYISSYDWGAYGVLTVEAVLTDGQRILGHLFKDESKGEILIPKRSAPDDPIAEIWKRQNGVTGEDAWDDSESSRQGDEHPGDGLTLYEEYRGFRVNGKHLSTDPKKKDLFVANTLGNGTVGRGALRFGAATGITVHLIRADELPENGINVNASGDYQNKRQHGVVIQGTPADITDRSYAEFPSIPGKTLRVRMLPSDVKAGGTYLERRVMHEIGHTCNIRHHGESDIGKVWWSLADDGKVLEKRGSLPKAQKDVDDPSLKYPIQVLENGKPVDPVYLFDVDPRSGAKLPNERWWVGGPHGQHSGVEDCPMRYDIATTVATTQPDTRYRLWDKEKVGFLFCSSARGTGVNAPDQKPEPRYGDADKGLGNCIRQFSINDAWIGQVPTN
jgi:hypothetical protein